MEPEPATCESSGRTVKEPEEALEAAYRERNEIIKTCKNEVEFHRTIASELENSIMEDFEWKLHEMEKDYNSKLKYSKETEELATALASVKGGSSDAVIEVIKKEKDAEMATKKKKWEEKRKKYHGEIEELKKSLKGKESELKEKIQGVQSETDSSLVEER